MYEIQHYTLCNGWINTWTCDDKPEYFDTYAHAKDALQEFLEDEDEAFFNGWIEDRYSADEFRIVEVELS